MLAIAFPHPSLKPAASADLDLRRVSQQKPRQPLLPCCLYFDYRAVATAATAGATRPSLIPRTPTELARCRAQYVAEFSLPASVLVPGQPAVSICDTFLVSDMQRHVITETTQLVIVVAGFEVRP